VDVSLQNLFIQYIIEILEQGRFNGVFMICI